jgi:hypothetical protein
MEFDIEIKKTTYDRVRLNDEDIKKVVLHYISRKYNIRKDDWVAEGDLTREVEYHGSHSWFEQEVIRKVTDFDVALLTLLRELK